MKKDKANKAKVLFLDIETAPILAYVWGIWEENIGLNQIKRDWHVLSWAAKWMGEDKMLYSDQRNAKDVSDDKKLLKGIRDLLDEADVIITHNGKRFDQKKLFARFVINEIERPSSFQHIDTLQIAKKHFAFTSNKLESLADVLKVKYKKEKHKKFPGFQLWEECLIGNEEAWPEMERYNKQDILVLEAVYNKLIPWSDTNVNFNVYTDSLETVCKCGSTSLKKNGVHGKGNSLYQRYKCKVCKAEFKGIKNILSPEKKKSLKKSAS